MEKLQLQGEQSHLYQRYICISKHMYTYMYLHVYIYIYFKTKTFVHNCKYIPVTPLKVKGFK